MSDAEQSTNTQETKQEDANAPINIKVRRGICCCLLTSRHPNPEDIMRALLVSRCRVVVSSE